MVTTVEIVRPFCDVVPDSAIHSAAMAFAVLHGDSQRWPPVPLAQCVAGQAALTCLTIEVALVDFERADAAQCCLMLQRAVGERLAATSAGHARGIVTTALHELQSDAPPPAVRPWSRKAPLGWLPPFVDQVAEEARVLHPWMPWPGTEWADSIERWDLGIDALLQRPWSSGESWRPMQLLSQRLGTAAYVVRIYEAVKRLVQQRP
jgi:hypothetical protein